MKLSEDLQFVPTQAGVAAFLVLYDLKLVSYTLATSGIENCTIVVQTSSDKYVLRVYRQNRKHEAQIQLELDFVSYLGAQGIPVAIPIVTRQAKSVSHINQNGLTWWAILMPYMPGEHATHYSEELLTNFAETQARIHNISALYQMENVRSEQLVELRDTHFTKLIPDRNKLSPELQALITRAEEYVVKLDPTLPTGLCHLDFDNGNVLSSNNQITAVLDFDDLEVAPYVMCLSYTLWDIAYDLGIDGVTQYLKTYQQFRALNSHELSFIGPIMLFRHYIIGSITAASGRMDKATEHHYLQLEYQLLDFARGRNI